MSTSLSGIAATAAFYAANGLRISDLASRRGIDSIPLKAYLAAGAVGAVTEALQHAVLGYSIQNKPVIQTVTDMVSYSFNMVYNVAQFSAKAVIFTVDSAVVASKTVGSVGSFIYHAATDDAYCYSAADSNQADSFNIDVGHSQYNQTPTHVQLTDESADTLCVPSSLVDIDLQTYA